MRTVLRTILALLPGLAAIPAVAQCPAVTGALAYAITATTADIGANYSVVQASSYTVEAAPTAGGPVQTVTVNSTGGATLTNLTPSTTYTVRIYSHCAGGQTSAPATTTFTTYPPPPANDDCPTAFLLTEAADCSSPTIGRLTSATPSAQPGGSYCYGQRAPSQDVWYRFVASSTMQVLNMTATVELGVDLWDVPCAGLAGATPLRCTALNTSPPPGGGGGVLTTQLSDLTAGHTYYLRIYPFDGALGRPGAAGTFTLCLNPGPPIPPNDECANAETLYIYGPTSCGALNGTVTGATASGIAPNSFCASGVPTARDVWYRFVATNTRQTVTLTANYPQQILLEAAAGSCGAAVPTIYCDRSNRNGAFGQPNPAVLDMYNLTRGQTYLVRAYSIGEPTLGAAGDFNICATGLLPCAEPYALAAVPTATAAQLSWQAVGTAPSYFEVEYGPPGFVPGAGTRTVAFTPTLALSGLRPNTDYCYYVQGNCSSNLGYTTNWAGPACFRTLPADSACTPPTSLQASSVSTTIAYVTWQAPFISNSTFDVEYGPAGFDPGTGTLVTGGFTGQFLRNLLPSTDYCFYVRRDCGNFVGPECFHTDGPATLPDLVVSTAQTLPGGTYRNVTITGTGDLALTGDLSVAGALIVQTGGTLRTAYNAANNYPSAATIIGPGSFELQDGAWLSIGAEAGISASGSTGTVQLRGSRTFSPGATYQYEGVPTLRQTQLTGSGLPAQVRSLRVGSATRYMHVQLSQAVAVRELLALTGGNLTTAGQPLTLLSSASGTAVLDNTGGVVIGTATVQRYNSSTYRGVGYRHYSAPISNATVGSLATAGFTPVVNGAYNTSATPELARPYPTVFGYSEARLVTSPAASGLAFDKGWLSPTSLSTPLEVGRGYTVHAPGTALVSFTGALTQNTTGFALSHGPSADAGWHLLGNPYASPLDCGTLTVGTSFTDNLLGVGAAIYVFESTGPYAGTYRTAVAGVGGSPVIASGQGFFVRTAATLPTGLTDYYFQLFNSNRVTTFSAADNTFHRQATETRPLLTLALRDAAGTGTDPASIYFTPTATAGFDLAHDAAKLPNTTGLNLASLTGAEEYAINGLPLLGTRPLVVPLTVKVPAAGRYELATERLVNFAPGTLLYLRDAILSTLTLLGPTTRYAFTLAGTSAPGRFSVEFRPAGALATAAQVLEAQVQVFPNPATNGTGVTLAAPAGLSRTATLVDALGRTVRTVALPASLATHALPLNGVAPGVYSLRVGTAQGTVTRKLVVE